MARYWLHNGFLQVEGEKMSKSLGNFVTVRELREGWRGRAWPGSVIRFAVLSTQYRQPLDFSQRLLIEAERTLTNWARRTTGGIAVDFRERSRSGEQLLPQAFVDALEDDLNLPKAIALMHEYAKGSWEEGVHLLACSDFLGIMSYETLFELGFLRFGAVKRTPDIEDLARRISRDFVLDKTFPSPELQSELKQRGLILLPAPDDSMLLDQEEGGLSAMVEQFLADRAAARARKDYDRADEIRKRLDAMGIALKDSKDPKTGGMTTTWEVKR
jgi:cysteinyl-tRNA synthetase